VTYIAYQDMVDDSVNGHGTHVCGSLLGRCYKDWGEYRSFNGVAHNAKIAFYDIGLAGSSTLNPPSNLESGLFGKLISMYYRLHKSRLDFRLF
jgi:Subtilase family